MISKTQCEHHNNQDPLDQHRETHNAGNQHRQRDSHRHHARCARDADLLQLHGRHVVSVRAIPSSVPAVAGEAVRAYLRHGGASPVQRAREDGAAYTGGPLGVDGTIAHCGDVVAVLDDGVALTVVVGGCEGRDVGVVDLRLGLVDG